MKKTTVNVYFANACELLDDALFERALASISEERQTKVVKNKDKSEKRLSLAASLLLSYALKKRGIDEREERYAEGPHGKPYLKNHPEIRFSLSHSGSVAMLAVSEVEVGCDVQEVRAVPDGLAARFFTEREAKAFQTLLTEEEKRDCFFRTWVAKESALKYLGEGFTRSPRTLETPQDGAFGTGARISPVPAGAGYFAAVCTDDGARILTETVRLSDLFN